MSSVTDDRMSAQKSSPHAQAHERRSSRRKATGGCEDAVAVNQFKLLDSVESDAGVLEAMMLEATRELDTGPCVHDRGLVG